MKQNEENMCSTCPVPDHIRDAVDCSTVCGSVRAGIDWEKQCAVLVKELREIERERKEVAKEIFNRIFSDDTAGDLGEFCGYGWIYDIDEARAIAKEYGVEL